MDRRRILLTLARGDFGLCLARALYRDGHHVFVAEPWRLHTCLRSRAVRECFRVPLPVQEPDAYMEALQRIIEAKAIDLLMPVGEEVFTILRHRDRLPAELEIFTDEFDKLAEFHEKSAFAAKARALGLAAPATTVLESGEELRAAYEADPGRVFKPVYSRFGQGVVVLPACIDDLEHAKPTPDSPWLAQDFVAGRPLATFSVAHRGRITAHACYPTDIAWGYSPTPCYRPVRNQASREWAETFVKATQYTGQIAFDFVEEENGGVQAVECNPRSTGGLHLLWREPGFGRALLDPAAPVVESRSRRAVTYHLNMLLMCRRSRAPRDPGAAAWWWAFLTGRLPLFTWWDPWPHFSGFRANFEVGRIMKERDLGVTEAATFDIAWNGERS